MVKSMMALVAAVCAGSALWADEPTITVDASSVKVSVPAGYAPGAKLVLVSAASDRGTQFAAWSATRELVASIPAAGGEFSATLADIGFPDGNCTVRAFFQSEFEKLDYLVVDASNDYVDPGMLDNQVYGIEYGYKPTGGGSYGKMICALDFEGAAGTHFRFEGAGSTTRFNFCACNTSGAYQYKAANLKTDGMNTILARNNAITVNGTKLGDYRTGPMGLRGSRVRLNTLNPNSASDHSYGWWYYLKIWGADDRLLIDYIPVRRTSDNVVGFYDQAEKRFVTPTGGGAFGAGTVVTEDAVFTDNAGYTPAVDVTSRTLTLTVENDIATVVVPAGFATGEKLYLVSDGADRGLDIQAWKDRTVLSESIPAAGGTFTCTLTRLCTFGSNVLRVFTAEDYTRLVSLTANEADDYNDTGVLDTLCYGFEYGFQPINGAGTYGKTFAGVGGTVRLERAGNGNNPKYNYCFYNAAYSAQVTLTFSLDGNACNNIVFRNKTLTHNGTSRGTAASAPVGSSGTVLRMNNKNLATADRDSGKWYYLRLFARSGCKLVDYVPAKRADGTVGFVDLAGRTFVTPTGGGAYTSDNIEQGAVSRIFRYTAPTAYECPVVPLTAEWIGGTDLDLNAATNWLCRNLRGEELPGALPNRGITAVTVRGAFAFNVATAEDVCWRSLKFENAALAADADWRGSFGGDLATGFLLDLAGHTLTVDDLQGSGTITDTGTPGGVLRVDVSANAKAANTGIFLSGALRLLKVGKGEYRAQHRVGADYAGGTVIEEGTVALDSRAHPNGANASITVYTNGVFDVAAASDTESYVWTQFPITLAGGQLENTGVATSVGCRTLGTVRLTADSSMYAKSQFGFLAQSYGPTLLDLGGHELKLDSAGNFHFYSTVIQNGRLNVVNGGWVIIEGTNGAVVGSPTVDLEFGRSPRLRVNKKLQVHDLVMSADDLGDWVDGTNKVEICGTFTPHSNYIHNYVLLHGSTINLSERTTVYPTVNPKKNAYRVTFAEGATVTVDLHGHEYDTTTPTQVMSWPEIPENVNFVLDAQTRRRCYLKSFESGLFVLRRGGTVLYLR
ncbi:MAG: hypothetical protein MJ249_04025 [Kiritimatiellae bacterium]|nr:hypothetical protein [Kiritimatiellia bacterium]